MATEVGAAGWVEHIEVPVHLSVVHHGLIVVAARHLRVGVLARLESKLCVINC